MAVDEDQIRYLISVDLTAAVREVNDFMTSAENMAQKIKLLVQLGEDLSKKYGVDFGVIMQAIRETDAAMKQSHDVSLMGRTDVDEAINGATAYATALKGVEGEQTNFMSVINLISSKVGSLGGAWGGVGSIIKTVGQTLSGVLTPAFAGLTLASTALVAEGKFLIDFFKEAVEYSTTYADILYRINAASNLWAMQGTPFPATDIKKMADEMRAGLPFYTKAESYEAIGNMAILLRNLNMTTDQTDKLAHAIAGASVVMGKDFGEAARMAGIAISSGWSEGLQRMGFNINKAVIAQRAVEMGAKRVGGAFSQEATAAATLSLILEQGDAIWDVALQKQDTAIGRIQKANTVMRQAKQEWGNFFIAIRDLWAGVVSFLGSSMEGWAVFTMTAFKEILSAMAGIIQVGMDIFSGAAFKPNYSIIEAYQEAFHKTYLYMTNYFDEAIAAANATEKLDDSIKAITSDQLALDDAMKIFNEYNDRITKATRDHGIDMQRDEEDHQLKMDRLREDNQQKIEEEQQKLLDDESNANLDYYNKELEAEQKFQEKMRQMRTKALFDLEDAIRQRDARQALRIIRQYQMDKKNAENDFAIDKAARARDFAAQQAQRRQQANERIKQMEEDAAREIARQEADYQTSKQRKIDDFNTDISDLKTEWATKIAEWAAQKAEELGLNGTAAKDLEDLITMYYGPGGVYDGLYDYSYGHLLDMSAMIVAAINTMIGAAMDAAAGWTVVNPNPSEPVSKKKAKGGAVIASHPTTAIFGEAGKELALFIPFDKLNAGASEVPLSDLMAQSQGAGTPAAGERAPIESTLAGMIQLMVSLSPDLEGRIVHNTADYVASRIQTVRGEKR